MEILLKQSLALTHIFLAVRTVPQSQLGAAVTMIGNIAPANTGRATNYNGLFGTFPAKNRRVLL